MRQYNFSRIALTESQMRMPDDYLVSMFKRAAPRSIFVWRKNTWTMMLPFIMKYLRADIFKKTHHVIVADRHGGLPDVPNEYAPVTGTTYSEYILLDPEIQKRVFGQLYSDDPNDVTVQNVIMVEGNSQTTAFQGMYRDYVARSPSVEAIYNVTSRGYIGKGRELVCSFKEDFQRFQVVTFGHVLVMGYKTWDAIPNKTKFILGNGTEDRIRRIVVLTNRPGSTQDWDIDPAARPYLRMLREPAPADLIAEVQELYKDMDADVFCRKTDFTTGQPKMVVPRRLIICGGARIYEKYASLVDTIHETLTLTRAEGDVLLPASLKEDFRVEHESPEFRTSVSGAVYRFSTLSRIA